jgi:hypothetical protein
MTSNKIAHVNIYPTRDMNRIEIFYDDVKRIHVFISARMATQQVQIYGQDLLKDFIGVRSHQTNVPHEANQIINSHTQPTRPHLGQLVQDLVSIINNQPDQPVPHQYNRQSRNAENTPFTLDFHNEEPSIDIENKTSNHADIPNPLCELMRSLSSSQPMTRQNVHQPPSDTRGRPIETVGIQNNTFTEQRHIDERLIGLNSNDDSGPPNRFVVNQQNGREVLIQNNTGGEADTNQTQSVNSSEVGNMNRIGVNIEQIRVIAQTVHRSITGTKLRPPNFNNRSRTGYRKNKNFIYSLTKVWLNQSEIDSFIKELSLIEESGN